MKQLVSHLEMAIIKILRERIPALQAIYLFGSSITEFERSESDIDIAFLAKSLLSSLDRWQTAEEIARNLNKDIDLVDLTQASTVMRFEIVASGKRIYCHENDTCELFEDYIYSSYAFFNEERKELLTDIYARGKIL